MGEGGRVGSYVLERRLGRGGMGEVWAARHEATGARHAVKLITLADADAALRAAREAEATARLDGHRCAVRVHGAFVEGARMALAMELVCLYDLVVAGRAGEALARAEELWAGSAMAAEARAGMATLLAEILELPSRRTPALREQARAWLARAEAVARELKPEGWRAWLEAETKGRYERAARELAR